jgi:heat shock protein HslJ
MKIATIILIISTLQMISCKKETIETTNMSLAALTTTDLIGQWKFVGYADKKIPLYEITLEFKNEESKNTFSGRSSVNFYFASFATDESKKTMSVSGLGSTKIAGSPEANQFEMIYFERLRNIERYEFNDKNSLILYLSNPVKEVMYFERK